MRWAGSELRHGKSLVERMAMQWLDAFRFHALALPNLAKFAIVLALIVGVPALPRRLRIPELVGLLFVGVLLGPHVLGLYGVDHPIVQFFADLGRLMLMFAAGLEINLPLFRKAQARSITFGVITTIVPLVLEPVYWRATPHDALPCFKKPVSSMTRTAPSSASVSSA